MRPFPPAVQGKVDVRQTEKKPMLENCRTTCVMRVLVADDEPQILELMKEVLEERGYEVLTACNGQEALDLYTDHRPPIVLADIRMPKMNGIDLLRQVKEMDSENVEVIMISGHLDLEDAIKALQYGARRYIRKPVDIRELLAAIKDSLS